MTGLHALLAPSSADLWGPDGCPGSVAMQSHYPDKPESEANREGTAAHWLLEQTLLKLTVPADAIAPNGVPINDEMREAIVEIVTDINDTVARCLSGDYWQCEQRVAAPTLVHADNWGTPDVFFVQHSQKTLHIWDFKYGHRFVDVFRNWQMIDYAACIVESERITDWQDWAFTFTIAQPRCYARDELGGTLREWFTDGKTIASLIAQLREAAHAASQPNASCKPSGNCLDCTAAHACEALDRAVSRVFPLVHEQAHLGHDARSLGLHLRLLDEAEDLLKAQKTAMSQHAQGLINNGQSVPYHKVDWSKPRTVWAKDKQAEAAQMVQMFGVPVELGVALPTPAQCIKQGVDETVIAPYLTKAPAAQKLVRIEDDSAAKVFGPR